MGYYRFSEGGLGAGLDPISGVASAVSSIFGNVPGVMSAFGVNKQDAVTAQEQAATLQTQAAIAKLQAQASEVSSANWAQAAMYGALGLGVLGAIYLIAK